MTAPSKTKRAAEALLSVDGGIEDRGHAFRVLRDAGLGGSGVVLNGAVRAYEKERGCSLPAKRNTLPAATKSLVFYSDAKASRDRFGITDRAGDPVWHGRFFDDDRDYDGEQSSGEMAAAKKAVWLAGKIAGAAGETVALTLFVDAEWLLWANAYFSPGKKVGGKARALAEAAVRAGIHLRVEHVAGADNPADAYTVCHGYQKYDVAGGVALLI